MYSEKILIVEDEAIIGLDLKKRLTRFGFNVVGVVIDGESAIEEVKKCAPDIILMDIALAGQMDGITTAIEIKRNYNIPVIFITSYSDEKTLQRAKLAEPVGYILKPFKEKEMYFTIDIALYKHQLEEKLKKQQRLFSAILNGIDEGIISTEENNKVVFVNPRAEELTGWKLGDAYHRPLTEVFHVVDGSGEHLPETEFIYEVDRESDENFDAVLQPREGGPGVSILGSIGKIRNNLQKIEGQVLVFKDVSKIKELTRKIDYQSGHDALTGLLNRKSYIFELEKITGEPDLVDQYTAVFIDIEKFKDVNEAFGHTAGDQLLKHMKKLLVKTFDAVEMPACARIGDDEFALILRSSDKMEGIRRVQELQEKIYSATFLWQDISYNINASIGIVHLSEVKSDGEGILNALGEACYIAKTESCTHLHIYNPAEEHPGFSAADFEWIGKIRKAVSDDQFELYYQEIRPADDLDRKHIEIFLRFKEKDGTVIRAKEFIDVIKQDVSIEEIDKWVISHIFKEIKSSQDLLEKKHVFHINLSHQSLKDPHFLSFITKAYRDVEIDPGQVCFEIAAEHIISSFDTTSVLIKDLHALGFRFAIDDFGTRFAFSSQFQGLPVEFVKIKGEFIRKIGKDEIADIIIEAFHKVSRKLNAKTIAKWIESEEILNNLSAFDIDFYQGYHIGKPAPLIELTKTVSEV